MIWDVLLFVGLAAASFAAMEGVAYLTHRHVMHGFLWVLHQSHHEPRAGRFERNDLFAAFFAVPSILFILLGIHYERAFLPVGIGMTIYGACYFVFHDVIVHQRIRLRRIPRSRYLRRIVQAHRRHHARATKEGGVSFGFLYAAAPRDRHPDAGDRGA